jgi:hypothetical protein
LIPEVNLLKLIPSLDHRPVCFVFLAVGALAVWRNAQLTARGSLQIGYRQTKPHIGWMLFENDV